MLTQSFTDILMTKRLQTLQSVDVAVERIVKALAATDQLDNTFIFYTSDHGEGQAGENNLIFSPLRLSSGTVWSPQREGFPLRLRYSRSFLRARSRGEGQQLEGSTRP